MKNILVLMISLIIIGVAQSQPMNKYTFENMVEVGDEKFELGDYDNALDLFLKASKERKDPNVSLRIAESYYMLRDYKRSLRYLKTLLKRDKTGMFSNARLLYAKCLKRTGEYQESYNEFRDFAKNTDDPDARKEAMLEVKGLELFNSLPENVEMEFKPLDKSVNKGFSIYGLQKRNTNDIIYFGTWDSSKKITLDGKSAESKSKKKSKRASKKRSKSKSSGGSGLAGSKGNNGSGSSKSNNNVNSNKKGDKRGQILVSNRNSEGTYDAPDALDQRINRIEYQSLYPAFSTDGNTLYFTRFAMEGTEVLEGKIFTTVDKDGEWGAPMQLENVNGDFISKMPALGEILGQEAIFFSSDMEGSIGGFDIFYSLINNDGSIGIPVNVGSQINTVDDELTPYYVDGKLYFSTNGLPGLGGYDIYFSKWNGKEWSKAENAGKGFNSSVDDLGLSISADGRNGFLLSNRPYKNKKRILSPTCCNHAYKVSARELVIKLIVEVNDENGKLNDAKVELVDVSKVKPESPVLKSNFSGNTFNFLLSNEKPYKAIASKEGYDPEIITFNTAGIFDDFTIEKKVTLKKAKPEVEIITINQTIRLNNIYYDFDDYQILPDAEKDLETLLNLMIEYPEMVIELSSHTDSQGSKKYNIKLSQNRAQSAKNWLTENGIDIARIKPVGYGEAQILNQCKDGVKCSEEEHRFNRRTEFKILEGPKEIKIEKQVFKNDK